MNVKGWKSALWLAAILAVIQAAFHFFIAIAAHSSVDLAVLSGETMDQARSSVVQNIYEGVIDMLIAGCVVYVLLRLRRGAAETR